MKKKDLKDLTDEELQYALFLAETDLRKGQSNRRKYYREDKFNLKNIKKEIARRKTKENDLIRNNNNRNE